MKKGQILALGTLVVLLAPYFIWAQIPPPENIPVPEIPTTLFRCTPDMTLRRCLLALTGDILRVILVIALAGAAIFIAWAGLIYIVGGEKKEERDKAKDRLIWAAVGLVVAFLAWVLSVIISRLISQPTV